MKNKEEIKEIWAEIVIGEGEKIRVIYDTEKTTKREPSEMCCFLKHKIDEIKGR